MRNFTKLTLCERKYVIYVRFFNVFKMVTLLRTRGSDFLTGSLFQCSYNSCQIENNVSYETGSPIDSPTDATKACRSWMVDQGGRSGEATWGFACRVAFRKGFGLFIIIHGFIGGCRPRWIFHCAFFPHNCPKAAYVLMPFGRYALTRLKLGLVFLGPGGDESR